MGKKLPPTTCEEIIRRRDELFKALSKESDRGVVLISASFLEEALEALLRTRFSIRHPKSKSSMFLLELARKVLREETRRPKHQGKWGSQEYSKNPFAQV